MSARHSKFVLLAPPLPLRGSTSLPSGRAQWGWCGTLPGVSCSTLCLVSVLFTKLLDAFRQHERWIISVTLIYVKINQQSGCLQSNVDAFHSSTQICIPSLTVMLCFIPNARGQRGSAVVLKLCDHYWDICDKWQKWNGRIYLLRMKYCSSWSNTWIALHNITTVFNLGYSF